MHAPTFTPRDRRHSGVPSLVLPLALVLVAHVAGAAEAPDRFRVDLTIGQHMQRLQSPLADSLGLGVTRGLQAGMNWDFEVVDVPMKSALRPGVHVMGGALLSDQTFAPQAAFANGVTIPPIKHAPTLEVSMGTGLGIPLALVDKDPGAQLFVRYQGAVILSSESGYGLMRSSQLAFGFERRVGVFDGSFAEAAWGSDQRYGVAAASGRWNMRFRLMSRLSGFSRASAPAPVAPAKGAPAPTVEPGRPLRVYFEMNVNSNGRGGPDELGATVGAAMDLATLMRGVGTLVGL